MEDLEKVEGHIIISGKMCWGVGARNLIRNFT